MQSFFAMTVKRDLYGPLACHLFDDTTAEKGMLHRLALGKG